MKKVVLLLAVTFAIGLQASAQNKVPQALKAGTDRVPVSPSFTILPKAGGNSTANKETGNGSRWYNNANEIVETTVDPSLQGTARLTPIWFDSTIRQRFTTGLGAINYISVAQHFDIITSKITNDVSTYGGDIIPVTASSWKIDSVEFIGAYVRIKNRPVGVVDTLILSVAQDNSRFAFRRSVDTWTVPYLPTGKDTLFAYTVLNVDSINRSALASATGAPRVFWKVPMTAAMGDTITAAGNITIKPFRFAVPSGGLTITGRNDFVVTATFKTGDTYTKNVDTVLSRNIFYQASYGSGAIMPYYYYSFNDRNMSNLMFYFDSSTYYPTVAIEGFNTTAFNKEFHDIGARVVCTSCGTVNVGNTLTNITSATVYPNPANNTVSIPFELVSSADAAVSITNLMGQEMMRQSFSKVPAGQKTTAKFDVSALSAGIYFYNVSAGAQHVTRRFVVAH